MFMQQKVEPEGPRAGPEKSGLPQGMPPVRAALESLLAKFFCHVAQLEIYRSLVWLLHKIACWGGSSAPVENVGSQNPHAPSPARPVRHARKRLGRLARLLFAVVPSGLQQALGYLPADSMAQRGVPEEIQKSPVRPSGKGSKRKQDDVALEEQQSWVEVLQEELPDEDETEDSTYEPTPSETDSEEYQSQNDTETDLEFEERDGMLVLKELPELPETLAAESSDTPQEQAGGNGGSSGGEALEEQQVAATARRNGLK